jgi:hypothetical protein
MSVRKKFERKIREKEQEIQDLERKILEAKAYLDGMHDALRLFPAEGNNEAAEVAAETIIKPGTAVDAVWKHLKATGKAMHIMDLLTAIGREATPENRASVGSTLAAYVRKGAIFSRPAPNTFGLVEWGQPTPEDVPPDDFGGAPVDNA